jgi:hypothetical protein
MLKRPLHKVFDLTIKAVDNKLCYEIDGQLTSLGEKLVLEVFEDPYCWGIDLKGGIHLGYSNQSYRQMLELLGFSLHLPK